MSKTPQLLAALLAVLLPACSAAGDGTKTADGSSSEIAVVNGRSLTVDDLEVQGKLMQLEQQGYQLKLEALEEKVADLLLEAEAKKRGVSKEELLEAEVESKIDQPTPEQVEAFYEQQKSRIRQPLEAVRPQVAELLTTIQRRERTSALIDDIRADADVKIMLDPPRFPIDLADAPIRGPRDAPITIVEFSDFQCPFCKRIQPTLSQLQDKYGDQLRWSFKDLPLVSIHPEAMKAAEAARCAGDQGKFWEYRAEMFDVGRLTSTVHEEAAEKLDLDKEPFEACLESGKYEAAVEKDSEEAANLGITGTPAFVINGVLLSGAQPLESFEKVIDRELERASE